MGATAARVLRDLRDDIIDGTLAQGARLTEHSLCARYAVSRVPVREALRTLAAEGFVEHRPHLGATVATISGDEAEDLYAVRTTIEEVTARRCAVAVRGGDGRPVVELSEIVDAGLVALAAGRAADLPALNTRVHLTMAERSGSASMLSLLRQVADRIQWIYATTVSEQGERSWIEHRGIVAAVAAGDEAAAAALARAHIANSRRGFRETRQPDVTSVYLSPTATSPGAATSA